MASKTDTVYAKVIDSRGIVESDKYYAEGDTFEIPRARFDILSRAALIEETERPKAKSKQDK